MSESEEQFVETAVVGQRSHSYGVPHFGRIHASLERFPLSQPPTMPSLSPRTNHPSLRARFHTVLRHAEAAANDVTDSQAPWWPFAFLRPLPEERLSSARVALLAVLQGLPVGLFLIVIDSAARRWAGTHQLTAFLVGVCAAVFLVNRLTLAYFWNRRAERLRALRARRDRWRNSPC